MDSHSLVCTCVGEMVSRSFLNFCACDLESGPCVVPAWKSQTLPWKSHTFLWRSRILLSSQPMRMPALLWKRDSQSISEKTIKGLSPWIWWIVFLFHVWAGSSCESGWFLGSLSARTCRSPVFEVFALCPCHQHWNLTHFSWQSSLESFSCM